MGDGARGREAYLADNPRRRRRRVRLWGSEKEGGKGAVECAVGRDADEDEADDEEGRRGRERGRGIGDEGKDVGRSLEQLLYPLISHQPLPFSGSALPLPTSPLGAHSSLRLLLRFRQPRPLARLLSGLWQRMLTTGKSMAISPGSGFLTSSSLLLPWPYHRDI